MTRVVIFPFLRGRRVINPFLKWHS